MRYRKDSGVVELSVRNITALLAKLDDHLSARTLVSPAGDLMVRAVENAAARGSETATEAASYEGVLTLTGVELQHLSTLGAAIVVGSFAVRSVPDDKHCRNRAPGAIYMPESGANW